MAQYDLLLTQNTHATGIEFTERLVNIAKGALLSGATGGVPTVLAGGTNGYQLVRDDVEVTGLKWVAIAGGHTQGSDLGTTNLTFGLDSDGFDIELTAESATKFGVKASGGTTYADMQAKDATFNRVSDVGTDPTAGAHLANKQYVDKILSTNNAMEFKANTLIATINALTTYNVGWTYRCSDAGTVWGQQAEIGDLVIAMVSRTGAGCENADWTVAQTNADGIVIGPASTTDNYVALFSGTTGKLLKAGTGALGTAAYVATGTFATAAQGTTADGAVPKSAFTAADVLLVGSGASTYSTITPGASTIVGKKASGGVVAMTKAETQAILNIADGATANTKAIPSEVNTGTDDVKFLTSLALAGSAMVKGPGAAVVDNVPVVWDSTTGKLVKSHASGALGTAAFVATGTFATSAQGTTADNAVPKSLYDANTVLYATADNTPVALTVGASTVVGRTAAGNIAALSPAEIAGVMCVTAPAAKNSTGVLNQIAFDLNYLYRCVATNVWTRAAMATNW
jgi:hypothetical protein